MATQDPRLLLAYFACDEFLGSNQVTHAAPSDGLFEAVEETGMWRGYPRSALGLLEPREHYELRGLPASNEEPDLYLVFKPADEEHLVGAYVGATVTVREELDGQRLRGQGLGTELILAAFIQCGWKPGKRLDFTPEGLRGFKRAHAFIARKAKDLNVRKEDLPVLQCNRSATDTRLPESAASSPVRADYRRTRTTFMKR